jgi:hypothetical protein
MLNADIADSLTQKKCSTLESFFEQVSLHFVYILLLKLRSRLLQSYGTSIVRLSSANTYSYDKRDITFADYCHNYMAPQRLHTLGNGEIRCF